MFERGQSDATLLHRRGSIERGEAKGGSTYSVFRCRHPPYRRCTTAVVNDGVCGDGGVSSPPAGVRLRTPYAPYDLEADERDALVNTVSLSLPSAGRGLIDTRRFSVTFSRGEATHARGGSHLVARRRRSRSATFDRASLPSRTSTRVESAGDLAEAMGRGIIVFGFGLHGDRSNTLETRAVAFACVHETYM